MVLFIMAYVFMVIYSNIPIKIKCKREDNLNLEYTLVKETMSMKTRGQLLCSEDGYTSGLELPTRSSERRHRPLAFLEELSSRVWEGFSADFWYAQVVENT